MRGPLRLAPLVSCLLTVAVVRAQTEPTTTTVPQPPTVQETTVRGTVPDLSGRWLVLVRIDVPGGQIRTTAMFWEVEQREGKLAFNTRYVSMPSAEQAEIDKANGASQDWRPSPDQLARIAAAWDAFPPQTTRPARVDHTLTGRDAFDQTFTSEPRARDARWVLLQNDLMDASAAPTIRQVSMYAALAPRDGGYTGNYTTTVIAAAPFPIPISFQGTFQLYRLPTTGRGLLARLTDLFSGCGRSR